MKNNIEKTLTKKIKTFDTKLKTSFVLIRKDLDEMQIIIDAVKKYIKKKDREYTRRNDQHTQSQVELQKDIDEFTQNISQLKLALSAVHTIKDEVVQTKDLAQIEDRIKTSFKQEINSYTDQIEELKEELKESNKRIKSLEKGTVHNPKKSWFSKN